MSRYYFTVASLPMLFYGGDTGPDRDEFLSICKEACSRKDMRCIEDIHLDPAGENRSVHNLARKWMTWETNLRNELVRFRAKDHGKDQERFLKEESAFYTEISDIVREAYSQESPLQAEEVLNQARWRRLEELEVGHHFDLEKLMVYHLKLQLNERKALFTKKAGEENFARVYQSIHESGDTKEPAAGEYR